MSLIFQLFSEYKKIKKIEKEKKRLLNKDMDFKFLERIIRECNRNENLKINIRLKDGTELNIHTTPKPSKHTVSDLIQYGVKENDTIIFKNY